MIHSLYLKLLPVILMLGLSAYSTTAQNLIPNPGFEEGSGDAFTNWNIYNQMNGMFSAATAASEYRSGARGLKAEITMPGEAWHMQIASDLIPTVSGEEYTFSIWVKGETEGTEIRFSTQPNALYSANYMVGTDWSELSWTFTANEEMTRILLDVGMEVNTYYLDDMYLEGATGGSGSCQLITNGGFEMYNEADTTFTGWEFYNELGGSSFEVATGDDAYSGDNALQANNAGGIERWGLQAATPPFPTVNGQSYTLNIWIKADMADANFIQFSTRDAEDANESQYTNSASAIGGDWMQISYTFTAIDDNTVITLNLGDESANTYYIDDVCVVYPDASENCLAVDNNGFETYDPGSNTFSDWTYYNQGNGSSFGVTMDAEDVYEGSNALVATTAANTQTFELQIASPSFYTLEGGTYLFKIWIKAETADANTIQFSAREAADPGSTETQYTTTASTIGTEWTQVTYEFTANSARSLVTLNLGGATENTFYIDAVCVETLCGTTYTAPADQEPIATGKEKFLGNVYAPHALPDFEKYFNQVTPENSGKWGSVEVERDVFNWDALDEARQFAKDNDFSFRFHVMLWGSQQPTWLEALSQEEQLEEIREWFEAVSTRYSGEDAPDYVEVVNEPLNQPPFYQDALTSLNDELNTPPSEYDWIVNAFKLARQYFPSQTRLMLNEYGIANTPSLTSRYVDIIRMLNDEGLIDAIGMQGHTFSTRLYGGTYEDLNTNIRSNVDSLGQFELPIVVTEMDIEGNRFFDANGQPQDGGTVGKRDSFQLAEYQRIFDIFWYHPKVVGITLWGWRPGLWQNDAEAYLIDPCTGQERPALQWLNTTIRDSDPMIDFTVSTDAVDAAPPLSLYPVPVNKVLTIEGITPENGLIRIFDLTGRLVRQEDHRSRSPISSIDVANLPPGLYIIQAGRSAQKFVKQ